MYARLLLLLPSILAVALLASGCGGGETKEGAAAGAAAAAEFAPADVAFFASVNTDTGSAQWRAAEALLDRFPSGDKLIAEILKEAEAEGLDWETDIKPALGPELGVVGFSLSEEANDVVVFTQPRDADKFAKIVAEADEPAVSRDLDGWTVVADSEEVLDRFSAGREAGLLSDSASFRSATADLAGDGLALLYFDGARLIEEASAGDAEAKQGLDAFSSAFGTFRSLALELVAEAGGVRLNGAANVEGGPELASYRAALPSDVPADALAYLSFSNLSGVLGQALDAIGEAVPGFDRQLGFVELGLGVSVRDDLLPLFAGEGALVVAPASPIPAVSLILEVEDEEAAAETVDKLVVGAVRFAADAPDASPAATTIAGIEAKALPLGPVSLYWAGFDGKLVVTTAREGIARLVEAGPKLADDPAFQQAREEAAMPDETAGFVYMDLEAVIRLLEGFAEAGGDTVPPEVSANLDPLESLLVYGTQEDGRFGFTGFLAVR